MMPSLTPTIAMFALVLAVCASTASSSDKIMRIAYAEYMPYSFTDGEKVSGIEVDILTESLEKRMGIVVFHQVFPWKRAQYQVEKGSSDAMVAVKTEARSAYAVPNTIPVTYWSISAFIKKRAPSDPVNRIRSIEEMKPFRIGAMRGNGWVMQNLSDYDIHYVTTMDSLVGILVRGRVDIIPDNTFVMRHYLKKHRVSADIVERPIHDTQLAMFLYVSRKSPFLNILEEFDQTLNEMKREGIIDEILARYR